MKRVLCSGGNPYDRFCRRCYDEECDASVPGYDRCLKALLKKCKIYIAKNNTARFADDLIQEIEEEVG